MYIGNFRLRKTWLKISLKSHLSGDPLTSNLLKALNTVEISTAPPLT